MVGDGLRNSSVILQEANRQTPEGEEEEEAKGREVGWLLLCVDKLRSNAVQSFEESTKNSMELEIE